MPDTVLARLAKNGGVVMVTFIPPFVSKETAAWGRDPVLRTSARKPKQATSVDMKRGRDSAAAMCSSIVLTPEIGCVARSTNGASENRRVARKNVEFPREAVHPGRALASA